MKALLSVTYITYNRPTGCHVGVALDSIPFPLAPIVWYDHIERFDDGVISG